MFNDQQKRRLLGMVNQVLPQHAEGLVSARARLLTNQDNFTPDECEALAFVLGHAEYQGNEQKVLAQMTEVAALRQALMPPVAPANSGKKAPTKQQKPAKKLDEGGTVS